MADQGRGGEGGVSVWGSQFKVDIDFTKAQTAATLLDQTFKKMPATARAAVSDIISELTRLEAKLSSVDRLATSIFGRGGVAAGVAAAAGSGRGATPSAAGAGAAAAAAAAFTATPKQAPPVNPPPTGDLFDDRSIHPASRPRLGGDGPVVTRYGPAGPIAPVGWNLIPGASGGIMYPAYTQGMASAYPHPMARDPYGGVQLAPMQRQRMLESVRFDTSRRGRGGASRMISSVAGYYPNAAGYQSGPAEVQYPPGYTPRGGGSGWGGGGAAYSRLGAAGGGGTFGGGQIRGGNPAWELAVYNPAPFQPRPPSYIPGDYGWRASQQIMMASGRLWNSTVANPRLHRAFSLNNLMRLAGGVYLGQTLGHSIAAVSRGTIGAAAAEHEGRILLAESLAGGDIGLSYGEAGNLANTLVESRYLVGTGNLSSVGLGLSRADLADQYRQLAPIVRLHATDEAQFSESLQRGGLARQLLVARDPVQGTRGAMVALSELYAGGPDRFRSLAMRFELPRTRMMELEAMYQAQGGSYDPAMILLDVLTEMGIGPEYVRTRARSTLSGQLARSGALISNARIDMFDDALQVTLGNISRLNDAVELWTQSDAYDAAIDWFDRLLGATAGLITSPLTNAISMGLTGFTGGVDLQRTAVGALDMMERAGQGQFWSMTRNADGSRSLLNAAEAFGEAAAAVLEERLAVLASAPVYNPSQGWAMNTGMLTAGGVVGGALLNRFMLGNRAGEAWRTMLGRPSVAGAATGLRAGLGVLGAGFMATGLPLLALTAGAGMVSSGIEENRHRARLGAVAPDFMDHFLEAQGVGSMQAAGLRAGQRAGSSSWWQNWLNPFSARRDWRVIRDVGAWITGRDTELELSARMLRQQDIAGTLLSLVALDPTFEGLEGDDLRRALVGRTDQMAREDERFAGIFGDQGDTALMVDYIVGQQMTNPELWDRQVLTAASHALFADQARIGSGFSVDIGGQTFGFDASQAPDILSDTGDFATNLVNALVTAAIASDEGDTLLALLVSEVGYVRANTAEIASNTSPIVANRFQLSQAPGLFYGYSSDADYRNVGPGSYGNPHGGGGPGGSGAAGAVSGGSRLPSAGVGPRTSSSDAIGGWISDMFSATVTSMPGDIYGSGVGGGLEGKSHQGIDYVVSGGIGAEVISRFNEPVTVLRNSWSTGGLGNRISVRTASGNAYDIGHFDQLPNWGVGDVIHPGQVIGLQGSTGTSTGAHVHMALMNQDPRNYDEQLFAAALMADFGGIGPLADSARVADPSMATSVQVHVNLANPVNATPEDIGRAVGQELHRRVRDGDFKIMIEDVQYHSARQGGRD